MQTFTSSFTIVIFFLATALGSCGQTSSESTSENASRTTNLKQAELTTEYWLLESNEESSQFVDKTGATKMDLSNYIQCFTDTFRSYAIVLDPTKGFVGIDKKQETLFTVFIFDNGPDYPKEGLFRIIEGKKIGYADVRTGKVIIPPTYEAAYPFNGGKAKVSYQCTVEEMGEHKKWKSNEWIFIDKTGKVID